MNYWRDHVTRAQTLLAQAQLRGDVPAKVLACLYDVMVEVTRAVMELEKPKEEEHDERHRI